MGLHGFRGFIFWVMDFGSRILWGLHGFRGFIFWVMDFGSRILWGISRIARIYFLEDGFWIADFMGNFADCVDLFFG